MLKYFLLVFTCLIITTGVKAQDVKKYWSNTKLTWLDFQEKRSDSGASELKYILGYYSGEQKFGDTIVVRTIAYCYMDTSLSWIHPDYKNSQYLRYNQLIFDIVELNRRKIQYEIDRANSLPEIENVFRRMYSDCTNEIDKFQKESNGGRNANSIDLWEQKIQSELNVERGDQMPDFTVRNLGYALHAGLGSGFFTGSLGEHFSPTFNIIFGFDFAYKNAILFLNGSLAGNKVRKEYFFDKNWKKDLHVNVAILDVSLGYAVLNTAKFKVTPFAGLGITELTGVNKDNVESGLRIVDANVIFGVNTDYKIRTRLKLLPNSILGVKEKTEASIRARLYVSRANLYSDLQGYSINLTIGICGFGNMIRLNK